jgi:hypothetical protein
MGGNGTYPCDDKREVLGLGNQNSQDELLRPRGESAIPN